MSKSILRFMIPKSLVEYIYVDSTVRQAIEKMNFHKYTAIPVLNAEGKYVGTLRNDDVFNLFWENDSFSKITAESVCVSDVLNPSHFKPVMHNCSMKDLIESVKEHNFVPVVDDRGCFIGIILRREVLNYLLKSFKDL